MFTAPHWDLELCHGAWISVFFSVWQDLAMKRWCVLFLSLCLTYTLHPGLTSRERCAKMRKSRTCWPNLENRLGQTATAGKEKWRRNMHMWPFTYCDTPFWPPNQWLSSRGYLTTNAPTFTKDCLTLAKGEYVIQILGCCCFVLMESIKYKRGTYSNHQAILILLFICLHCW